jgi:hypothetical protein
MSDVVAFAEIDHLANATHGETGFRGAGFVVGTGVEDTAVMAGLMPADGGLLFEDGDFSVRKFLPQTEGRCKADDSASDDDDTQCDFLPLVAYCRRRPNRFAHGSVLKRLPVGDGTVRAEVGLRACGDWFSDFGNQLQLFHIEFHAEAGAVVRVQLAVFEIQADG